MELDVTMFGDLKCFTLRPSGSQCLCREVFCNSNGLTFICDSSPFSNTSEGIGGHFLTQSPHVSIVLFVYSFYFVLSFVGASRLNTLLLVYRSFQMVLSGIIWAWLTIIFCCSLKILSLWFILQGRMQAVSSETKFFENILQHCSCYKGNE